MKSMINYLYSTVASYPIFFNFQLPEIIVIEINSLPINFTVKI